jgi:hypothetical protein
MALPRLLKLPLIWLAYFAASLPLMFLISCSTIYLVFANVRQNVDAQNVPPRFPVLVITHGEPVRPSTNTMLAVPLQEKLKSGDVASIVLYSSLPAFTSQYDSFSYLVPASETAEVEDALRKHEFVSVEIRAAGAGRQQIALDASMYDDDSNQSWYLASDRTLTPQQYHSHNGLGLGMASGIGAGIPMLLLSAITASLMTWKKSRPPKAQAAAIAIK